MTLRPSAYSDVGTISDWITHGHNGHIVPVGDANALADSIARLLDDRAHFEALQQEGRAMRSSLSLEHAVEFWRDALSA